MAAPACPRMLGDWGAEVFKIEPPAGDPMRRQAPVFSMPLSKDEPSAFDLCGVNKKFVYPSGNERVLTTTPVQFKSMGRPETVLSKPLGFHTDETLRTLGYSQRDIDEMRQRKAIV